MGEEIPTTEFSRADYTRFASRLAAETDHLKGLFQRRELCESGYTWGFELEAWLLDHNHFPHPVNEALLAAIDDPEVVPELSRFNVELNTPVRDFAPHTLSDAEAGLNRLWARCNAVAHTLDTNLVMIGTLPTLRDSDLSLANMSPLKRYYALNHELIKANRGRALKIDIAGREHLVTEHADVMLEAAATSLQIHLKMPASLAHLYYNASQVLSAPILAASANSPLLFGRTLWEETRIPLFEQSIAGIDGAAARHPRVIFGSRFLSESLFECFAENRAAYDVLLPICFSEPPTAMRHLRLHNGTIWRWNRPLVGIEDEVAHVRLEHRALPAGPSVVDMIANAALYIGAVHEWVMSGRSPGMDAACAERNFYAAAGLGLDATLSHEGRDISARNWLLDTLLEDADAGLARFGLAAEDRARYLGIVRERVASGRTGASWQRRFYLAHERHAFKLMASYCEQQRSGLPVHEWSN